VNVTYQAYFKPDKEGNKEVFSESEGIVQWMLGDNRLPNGLWKAVEKMRKVETSEIMIKPKSACKCVDCSRAPGLPGSVVVPEGLGHGGEEEGADEEKDFLQSDSAQLGDQARPGRGWIGGQDSGCGGQWVRPVLGVRRYQVGLQDLLEGRNRSVY